MNMRGFIGGLIVSISLCLLFVSSAWAVQQDSLWPRGGVYTVNRSQSPDYSAIDLCAPQTIKTIFYTHLPPSERDACIYETTYGSIASSGHIKRFVGDYMQLSPSVVPVPGTTKMYARSCSSSCLIYYDTAQGFYGSNTGSGYKLYPMASPTPVKNPATQQTLRVFSIGFSSNGKWLAIETTGGFVRHDTETGDYLKFSSPRGSYGVGQDPLFQYSISDDGRYIVLSGSNYRNVTVFDLATCTGGSATDPVGVLAACESVELADVARSKGFQVTALYGAGLRAGDREVTAYGPDNSGKTLGYVFRLDSLESRADYVALGDSFSSGEGDIRDNTRYLAGTDGTAEYPSEKCHISNRSYPYLLSDQDNSNASFFKSFACSGSVINDILAHNSLQYQVEGYMGRFSQAKNMSVDQRQVFQTSALDFDFAGRIPQLKFIEKYQPKNITITIGGNDAGFGGVISACVTAGTCEFESTERAAKGLEMYGKYQVLRETYRKILRASPDANLYVLSYPQLIDDDIQCNPNVGMNAAERTFVRESVGYFNKVIRQAALAEGATFIDITDSLSGEALCSSKLLGLAVNGIVDGDDKYAVIGQESFHPNSRGHELIASYINDTYGTFPDLIGETCPLDSCGAYRAPAIPDYFNVLPTTVQRYRVAIIDQFRTAYKAAEQVQLKFKSLIPKAVATVSIHSTPRPLGTIIADASGDFNATITLPSDLEPGYHELHLDTTTLDGTKVSYYQPLMVIGSEDDYDGDGIPNALDTCNFVEVSGVDIDVDGIDDACDGDLYVAPTVTSEPGGTQESPVQQRLQGIGSPVVAASFATDSTSSEDVTVSDNDSTGYVAGISDIKMDKEAPASGQLNHLQRLPNWVWIGGVVAVLTVILSVFLYQFRKH